MQAPEAETQPTEEAPDSSLPSLVVSSSMAGLKQFKRTICKRSKRLDSHSRSIAWASSPTSLTRTILSPGRSTFSGAPLLPHWRFQASTALPVRTSSMTRPKLGLDGMLAEMPNSPPSATRKVRQNTYMSASSSASSSTRARVGPDAPSGGVDERLPPTDWRDIPMAQSPKPNASASENGAAEGVSDTEMSGAAAEAAETTAAETVGPIAANIGGIWASSFRAL
mmetsp:Transcript_87054/g.251423  ORF Transcript_87054/g.251423 Transcript_87054/m.251423 type:complete len:224 (-) Transcript_87054:853-1524(-)